MNDHAAHPHDEPSSGYGDPPGGQDHPGGHDNQYFLPGMVIMQVDHPVDVDQCKLADLINPHLKNLGIKLKDKLGDKLVIKQDLFRKVQTQNILTFPHQDDQKPPFSLVRVELNSTKQVDLITILTEVYKELKFRAEPFELGEPGQGVIWQTVSPDWLLGSASHGAPHPPSPGSWPVPPKKPVKGRKFSRVKKDSDEKEALPFAAEKGAEVHVAILDTAPCSTDLDEAFETWHTENELIDQLLKPEPDRKLRLVTDIYAEIELSDCSLAGHRYWMADHGLFIASEIASIAPESKIHLIKAFTSYGSASTLTLAQGLIRVLNDEEIGRPLVVNCSFGLAAPTPNDPDFEVHFEDFPDELKDPDILGHMQTSLHALFDELTNRDQVIVVAAAGDDTGPGQQRAPARFPAAYKKVIGVGALPKDLTPGNSPFPAASYSNLADDPPSDGYMVIGGEPGEGFGVLGLYISELPVFHPGPGESWPGRGHKPPNPQALTRDRFSYETNQSGEAEWAGASFAAPIITGILANWCSQPPADRALDPAQQPINVDNARLALNNMSQTTTTIAGEQVILVTQGTPTPHP